MAAKAEQDAVEFATRAVAFDQQNLFDAAIYYYRAAAEALNSALLQGSLIAGIQEKSDEYIHRAEELFILKVKTLNRKERKNEQQLELERADFLLRQGLDEDESGNSDEAIELYTQAVELCLNARKVTPDANLKEKLANLAKHALDRAENLKNSVTGASQLDPGAPPLSPPPPPVGLSALTFHERNTDHSVLANNSDPSKQTVVSGNESYSKEEIAVLRIGSLINGREYVPFMSCDLKERFAYPMPFEDRNGKLTLSPKQKSAFKAWVRPEDVSSNPKVIELVDCFSIRQTVVSDCSFIASLAVCALYEKRFRKKIITRCFQRTVDQAHTFYSLPLEKRIFLSTVSPDDILHNLKQNFNHWKSVIYPQNRAGEPVYNPCGKYMVKLNINGIRRKVIIDDLLPMGVHRELLCSYSNNRNEFWVSILEKAYMKVMGGYDFPGSNSNIDLNALTGWIPERMSIEDSSFNKDQVFKMLSTHYRKGDVLITLATGEISEVTADRAGLVPTHAYALLDIREVLGRKLFLLKNPWSHLRWKGNYSEHDTVHWTPELKEALKYDPRNAQMFDNGVFWIDYESVCHFFSVIYLSWEPKMFKYTYCIHQCWKAGAGPVKDMYNIGENPQFALDLKSTNSTVWILLTRHITERDDFAENREYIAVVVYKNEGRKVYFPYDPEPYIDGVRINSPHYLCKIIVPESGATRYTLVVSQYEKTSTIYYTLRAYSTCPFRLTKIHNVFKYKQEIKNGEWTDATAGGCMNHPATYSINPVYQVNLQSPSDDNHLLVDLKGPKQYNVGFEIVTVTVNNPNSPGYFSKKSSGAFRSGFTILELSNVPSGTYNIIPSTFKPGQKGPFFLTIQSSSPLTVNRLR